MYISKLAIKQIETLRLQRAQIRSKIRCLKRDFVAGRVSINKIHEIKFYRQKLKEYNQISVSDLFMEEDLLIACGEMRDRFSAILAGKQMKRDSFNSSYSEVRFTIKEMPPDEWAKNIE